MPNLRLVFVSWEMFLRYAIRQPTCTCRYYTSEQHIRSLHVVFSCSLERETQLHVHCFEYFTQCGSSPDGEELPVDPLQDSDGIYGVILRIVKAGCHPVAIAQVVEH